MESKGKFTTADAVFERISELYNLRGDTEIGAKLKKTNQNVYQYRRRDSIPYDAIIENCPPRDWEYILTGQRTAPVAGHLTETDRAWLLGAIEATIARSLRGREGQH